MAQPTIYADIDCNGQVEVKVNNDTGYDCTIITSTGVNETISSIGSKKLYMSVVGDPSTAIGGSMRIGKTTDNTFPCIFTYYTATAASLQAGHDMAAASSGNFSIRGLIAPGVIGTWDIWIDN